MVTKISTLFLTHTIKTVRCSFAETRQNVPLIKKVKHDFPVYVKKDDHFKFSKVKTVEKLAELLNLRRAKALDIVNTYEKEFRSLPTYSVGENYFLCISNGLEKDVLIENPSILTSSFIQEKIKLLRKLHYDLSVTAPLLILCNKFLENVIYREISPRIPALSELFEVPEKTICKLMSLRTFLITVNYANIETNFKLLIAAGCSKEDIMVDLWVLRYSPEQIRKRICFVQENNIDKFRTWMVRASDLIMDRYVRRRSDAKEILGENSLIQYLSEKMQCSESWVECIIEKHPALQNKCLRKLNEMIDFLTLCGFTPLQICRSPKILTHSIDTVKERLKQLDSYGKKLDSLHVLTKSKKQFDQYCEQFKPLKNKR